MLVDWESQVVDLLEALGELAEHVGDALLVGAARELLDGFGSERDVLVPGGLEELCADSRAQRCEHVPLGLLETAMPITITIQITIRINTNDNDSDAGNDYDNDEHDNDEDKDKDNDRDNHN